MSDPTTDTPVAEISPAPVDAAPPTSAPVLTTPAAVAPTIHAAVAAAGAALARTEQASARARAKVADAEATTPAPDPVAHMLASLQSDLAATQVALKASEAARAKAERERDASSQAHDALNKRMAEGAIVSKLRDLAPAGVPESDLRGALIGLAEAGKVDRYAVDAEATAKAAAELLKAGNSTIFRVAPPPGGPLGAPPQQVRPAAKRGPI